MEYEAILNCYTVYPRHHAPDPMGSTATQTCAVRQLFCLSRPCMRRTPWTWPHHCGHIWELTAPHLSSRAIDLQGLTKGRFCTSLRNFVMQCIYFQIFVDTRNVWRLRFPNMSNFHLAKSSVPTDRINGLEEGLATRKQRSGPSG